MKNYIVRICRQQNESPGLLVGVVEDPELEERKAFRTVNELLRILHSDGPEVSRKKTVPEIRKHRRT